MRFDGDGGGGGRGKSSRLGYGKGKGGRLFGFVLRVEIEGNGRWCGGSGGGGVKSLKLLTC